MARTNRSHRVRANLPVHPVPDGVGHHQSLTIDGLVSRPMMLDHTTFAELTHRAFVSDFGCEEGWTVPQLRWRGVAVQTLADLVQPLVEPHFVRVSAGAYEVTLDVSELKDAMLCDELNGKPLTREHGAPWRLVSPGAKCFSSVKWVDRIEFTNHPGEPDGERIARARLRQL